MNLPFWKKDKRRIDSEVLDRHIHLRITRSEEDFLNKRANEECRSKNSIMRQLIKELKGRE